MTETREDKEARLFQIYKQEETTQANCDQCNCDDYHSPLRKRRDSKEIICEDCLRKEFNQLEK